MVTEQAVLDCLKVCYDPEIPVNIVDLGLIYGVTVNDSRVEVDLTLTSIGCPLAAELVEQVRSTILTMEGVDEAAVNLVWTPPWTPQMASEDGKADLAMMGVPI